MQETEEKLRKEIVNMSRRNLEEVLRLIRAFLILQEGKGEAEEHSDRPEGCSRASAHPHDAG